MFILTILQTYSLSYLPVWMNPYRFHASLVDSFMQNIGFSNSYSWILMISFKEKPHMYKCVLKQSYFFDSSKLKQSIVRIAKYADTYSIIKMLYVSTSFSKLLLDCVFALNRYNKKPSYLTIYLNLPFATVIVVCIILCHLKKKRMYQDVIFMK